MNRREAIKAVMAMPAVTRIQAAEVKPGDVIVMEAPGPISDEAIRRIKETAETVWPGRKVVVLGDGLKLKVVGQ